LEQDRARPLMLTEAPVMRFALIRWDDQTWKFLWSIPALLLDGWSWPVVFQDVGRLYEAYSGQDSPPLEPVRPYRDYIRWLGAHSFDEAREFWRASLAGFREPTPLPHDAPDPAADGERYLEIRLPLSAETTGELQTAARRLQITLSTLVQGAWGLLLGRQSGRSDVVIGAAFAARPADLPGVESIVGPFVNNLPVRISIRPDAVAGDYLRGLQARSLELSPFQFTPLMEIQGLSEVPWRHRLFDSLIVFQNYAVGDAARRLGGGVEIADFTGPLHTHYPLMLVAEPGAALGLTLVYDRRSLARATAESWGRDVVMLLERMPAHLDKPLAELLSPLAPPPAGARPPKLRLSAPSQNYMPPQTDLERTIADLWRTMFGVERVGVEENFFELGGHSSLLVQMHARLREILKIDLPIVSLFEHPTVRSLARHLARADGPAPEAGRDLQDRAQRQRKALAQMKNRQNK